MCPLAAPAETLPSASRKLALPTHGIDSKEDFLMPRAVLDVSEGMPKDTAIRDTLFLGMCWGDGEQPALSSTLSSASEVQPSSLGQPPAPGASRPLGWCLHHLVLT